MAEVELSSRVETVTRTEMVGRFLEEVVRRLSYWSGEEHARTLWRGVVERHYIGTVMISYLRAEKLVARVQVGIDYRRHRLNIDRLGAQMPLDPRRSVASQISPPLESFLAFFEVLSRTRGVTTELTWYWADGIDSAEARRWMGTTIAPLRDWHAGRREDVAGRRPVATALHDEAASVERLDAVTTGELRCRPGALDEVELIGQVVIDGLRRQREGGDDR